MSAPIVFLWCVFIAATFAHSAHDVFYGEFGVQQNPRAGRGVVSQLVKFDMGGSLFEHFIACPHDASSSAPVVMLFHDWLGLGLMEQQRAVQFAEAGFIALAVDLYGLGVRPNSTQEAGKVATALRTNVGERGALNERLDVAISLISGGLKERNVGPCPTVDLSTSPLFLTGFCLGGGIALDAARRRAPTQWGNISAIEGHAPFDWTSYRTTTSDSSPLPAAMPDHVPPYSPASGLGFGLVRAVGLLHASYGALTANTAYPGGSDGMEPIPSSVYVHHAESDSVASATDLMVELSARIVETSTRRTVTQHNATVDARSKLPFALSERPQTAPSPRWEVALWGGTRHGWTVPPDAGGGVYDELPAEASLSSVIDVFTREVGGGHPHVVVQTTSTPSSLNRGSGSPLVGAGVTTAGANSNASQTTLFGCGEGHATPLAVPFFAVCSGVLAVVAVVLGVRLFSLSANHRRYVLSKSSRGDRSLADKEL